MPGAARLDCATHPHNIQVLAPVGRLVSPGLLDLRQAEGEGDGVGEKGHESALLQLVTEDGRVREPGGPDRQSCCRISDGN